MRFFLLPILFWVTMITAQIRDLKDLVHGDVESFSVIKELDGSVYGYYVINRLDEVEKNLWKYEYILLDKNLNKVANGSYNDFFNKWYLPNYNHLKKVGDQIAIGRYYEKMFMDKKGAAMNRFSSYRKLDLKTNTLSVPFRYKENKMVEIDVSKGVEEVQKEVKKEKNMKIYITIKDGYVLRDQTKWGNIGIKEVSSLKAFNFDNTLKWEYDYKPKGEKSLVTYSVHILDDENVLLATYNRETKVDELHCIDQKTGKLKFKYLLENKAAVYSHFYNIHSVEGKIFITGKMSPYKSTGYEYDKAIGLYKIELSSEGKELAKKYIEWEKIADHIDINKKGKMKNGYRLNLRDNFVFTGGNISFVFEKMREASGFVANTAGINTGRVEDLIVLNLDKDFNIKNAETIEKEKTVGTGSDYLYAQFLKDKNEAVFFYADYRKEEGQRRKNWVLGINHNVKGKTSHEVLPISAKDFEIYPFIAKEGYILLAEKNKNEEYGQIRLEKLNLE